MLKAKHIVQITVGVIFVIFLQSCASLQQYERPTKITENLHFRTDQLPKDSVTMATLGWQEFFQDSLLQDYIALGLKENIDIRRALENIHIAEAYLYQAKVNQLPSVSVGPNVSYQTVSLHSLSGQNLEDRQHNVQYGLSVQSSWEIDIWGKLKSQREAIAATYLQSVAAHQAVKSEIVAGIATGYFQLLALDEQARVLNESIGYYEQYLATSKALKKAGIITEVAVQRAKAQLLNAKSSLVTVQYSIQVRENILSVLLNQSPGEIERNTIDKFSVTIPTNIGYPISLLRNRPDVRSAELELKRTFELVNVAKTMFYPSLNINANSGIQSIDINNFFSLNSIFASVVGGLTQPIFNKRQIKTNYKVSLSKQQIAYLDFRKALLNASNEVSSSLASIEAQENIINLKQQEYEAYTLASEMSEELVNYGLANYLEVITANQQALNSKLNLINSKFDLLISKINLYKALGGGWR